MSAKDLPTLRVEDIQAMSEEAWEELFERIATGDTTYLLTEEGESRDVVMVPFHILERMVQATGGQMPSAERTPEDERFAEVFASLRGSLKDGPDLDV